MTPIPNLVRIVRLMHIDNLSVCIQRGGLHAPNSVPKDGLPYKTIHNIEIQHERQLRHIPCGPKGTIHDYVPFYFGVRSPMLYQLCTGQVENYDEGQDPLIYAVSTAQAVSQANIPFVFSDGHGIAAYTEWFDDLAELTNVDWDTVDAKYWYCTMEDPDRQRRKQAEFLVYQFCPWDLVQEIGVINDATKTKVLGIMAQFGKTTPVQICRQWYY